MPAPAQCHVAIACGGTGGHFFPGVAVARELVDHDARVTLFISEREIDRRVVASLPELPHVEIPAMAFSLRHPFRFLRGLRKATRQVRGHFENDPPQAVLAMGGFTAAAPIRVGRQIGAATFLHESNAIPGRANRFLARWSDEIFIGFAAARGRFNHATIHESGTPVRPEFRNQDRSECRRRLGFAADQPLILVTGGSQGARAINQMVTGALSHLPEAQWLHLCGSIDLAEVKAAHEKTGAHSKIHEFFDDMPSALVAADLVVSRAGASSLAELAAAKAPAILVPLPSAVDDHQRANARAAVDCGGAVMLEQAETTSAAFAETVNALISNPSRLEKMGGAMNSLDRPDAATTIAGRILKACEEGAVDSGQ
jgi:UDP-N-acetylglucosamine--N-acetylmuramyl-(pentapeptide) pyrophosphoryl-undecaprenol N-acetylglucosamine transferase